MYLALSFPFICLVDDWSHDDRASWSHVDNTGCIYDKEVTGVMMTVLDEVKMTLLAVFMVRR